MMGAPPKAPAANASHQRDLAGQITSLSYTQPTVTPPRASVSYQIDPLHRRTQATREDGSSIAWAYNARSEVASSARQFAGGTAIPMESFAYTYDDIGNCPLLRSRPAEWLRGLLSRFAVGQGITAQQATRSKAYTTNALTHAAD
jgi:hypothetical protein